MQTTKIALFQGKQIRKVFFKNEWWFVVEDVILVLIDSNDPKQYIQRMKLRDLELAKGWVQIVHTLKVPTPGGEQKMNCATTKGIFRIIQSISSPKAEPFKQWLARVGYERVQEIENPELAQERMKQIYEQKGHSKDWIDKRLRGMAIRQNLTDEWKERGVIGDLNYAILTAEISKATFGITPGEYKKLKGLKRENLRDHMTDLELIFTMLGERVTTEISQKEKPRSFIKNKKVAKRGGRVAGTARNAAEKEIGRSVMTNKNFLKSQEKQNKILGYNRDK